ncbi:MAG: hypothetical protein ACI83P_002813 [Janthinobacterium sp.]|jgi:hypothetical protein
MRRAVGARQGDCTRQRIQITLRCTLHAARSVALVFALRVDHAQMAIEARAQIAMMKKVDDETGNDETGNEFHVTAAVMVDFVAILDLAAVQNNDKNQFLSAQLAC